MAKINPYNFVPLRSSPDRDEYTRKHRIGYAGHNDYPKERIDALGVFGGQCEEPGLSAQIADAPSEPKPDLPNKQLVWLKEIDGNQLIFISPDRYEGREEHRRNQNHYQGKKKFLTLGDWFELKDTNQVLALKK